jgi:hypothetical protein
VKGVAPGAITGGWWEPREQGGRVQEVGRGLENAEMREELLG